MPPYTSGFSSLWHKQDPLLDPRCDLFSRLPTELILPILDDLYRRARGKKINGRYLLDPERATSPCWKEVEDYRKLDFFPFNVATMCSAWLSRAVAFPQYWTRLVLLVGRDFTPLWAVRTLLEASGSFDIEVVLTRRHDDFEEDDPDERWRLSAVLELISPHLHRILHLQIAIAHPESLQGLSALHGSAAKLVKLELTATKSASADPWTVRPAYHNNPKLPALRRLKIDAWNFYQLFIGGPFESGPSRLRYLSLWSPETADMLQYRLFSAKELIRAISRLTHDRGYLGSLELDRVQFAPSTDPLDITPLQIAGLTFTRLAADVTPQVTRLLCHDVECIMFRQCELCPTIENIGSFYFYLRDIKAGDPDDLIAFLQRIDPRSLEIDNCPGVNDSVLAQLSAAQDKNEWFIPQIQDWRIYGCPNVTSGGVRRMMEARLALYYKHRVLNPDWEMADQPIRMPEEMRLAHFGNVEDEDVAWLKSSILLTSSTGRLEVIPDARLV